MMKYFPFDSNITGYDNEGYPIYDRPADSSLLRGVISQFVSTGIFPTTDCFKVEASEGMLVTVKPGSAVINGVTAMEETTRTLTVQSSDDTYDRIDTVVLRYNNDISVRSIDLYVLEGTPAATPTPPTLTRQTDYYELGLANIYIPVNSAVISDERITDTRTDEERCGYAKGLTQEFVEYVNERFATLTNDVSNLSNIYNQQIPPMLEKVNQLNAYVHRETNISLSRKPVSNYSIPNDNKRHTFNYYLESGSSRPSWNGVFLIDDTYAAMNRLRANNAISVNGGNASVAFLNPTDTASAAPARLYGIFIETI